QATDGSRFLDMEVRTGGVLGVDFLAELDHSLEETDAALASDYPGEDERRQPIHTVYVPADTYSRDLVGVWGLQAEDLLRAHGGAEALCSETLALPQELSAEVAPRVEAKLADSPIEDLRIDFEDGYGDRGDEAEDAEAVRTAIEVAASFRAGEAPPFVGIRFKCFEQQTRRRGVRSLDLFLATLLAELEALPAGLVLTLPKVSTVSQVEAMVAVCAELETAHALPAGALRFEIQVETPQLILGADGRIPLAAAVHAGAGRVTSLHYGTFDYSASLQIAAAFQAADHPAADFAKHVMQVAVAGTGVHLSDGSTNILPIGSAEQVQRAWTIHAGLVRRALERGIYQGWDMHPGHLPTRFAATFAFFRQGYPQAARRLSDFADKVDGEVLDEPATARALARFLHRGLACGAVDEAEVRDSTGFTPEALAHLARPRSDTAQPHHRRLKERS
ncbi:MAG: hypothetical protein WB471_06550, partial [Nocardioides sp.]